MKNKLILSCIILFSLSIFSASAQIETRLGGFLAYGSEIENPGLGVNAEFEIMDNISISPSLIYYFPKGVYYTDINWWEVNANANYYFLDLEMFRFYGLGGLNYSHVSYDYDSGWNGFGSADTSEGKFGFNLGGGATFDFGARILPFAELKYVIMDGGQAVLAAGVKINL